MANKLRDYLVKEGRVTGPLSFDINTSHSGLQVWKLYLSGGTPTKPDEAFLRVGRVLHSKFLTPDAKIEANDLKLLSLKEQRVVRGMLDALSKDPSVKLLMQDATCEVKEYVVIEGVKVAIILDIHQKKQRRGADLKTTVCKYLADFVSKSSNYGYFNQAWIYKTGAKLKEFYFIPVQKIEPHAVLLMNALEHKDEMEYAGSEVKFLLYLFRNYGKVNA